ncbi:MAG: hypothetical protein Ct9H90mP8_0610 [Pseudomonadota bacterium]|nr:MAG: hypothetical protein Ct9H90mP8_0610 [Pseudomonadota bacterium]
MLRRNSFTIRTSRIGILKPWKPGIPDKIFPDALKPGKKIGNYQKIPVTLPACHDTASAVVSVPSTQGILHSSQRNLELLGIELDE